ncbi:hypothetical protein AKJ16_DCAP00555 [Drosera capensis]
MSSITHLIDLSRYKLRRLLSVLLTPSIHFIPVKSADSRSSSRPSDSAPSFCTVKRIKKS